MKQYLLSANKPDGPPSPPLHLKRLVQDVGVVVADMMPAGAWFCNGGLPPASTATVLRLQAGELLMTDGPYAEGKEHVGGICIINAPDLDAALDWGRKLARAVTLPIEVRPFQEESED